MSDNSLPRRLKEGRERAGLTLEQVAQKLGVNRSTVSRWESGEINRIKPSDLLMLASVYKIDVKQLAGDGYKNVLIISPSFEQELAVSSEEHFLLSLFRKASAADRERVFSILTPYAE